MTSTLFDDTISAEQLGNELVDRAVSGYAEGSIMLFDGDVVEVVEWKDWDDGVSGVRVRDPSDDETFPIAEHEFDDDRVNTAPLDDLLTVLADD